MQLLVLMIFSLSFFAVIRVSPLIWAEPLTDFLHNQCLFRLPESSLALPELKALVCAENFSGLFQSEVFITSGLIHLFVVSGSHLLVLQKIYEKINPGWPQKVFFVILFIYAGACEFNAPVTRSLIAIYLVSFLMNRHLKWPRHFILLLTGLMTLLIEPAWLQSISLQLSWLAAFVVSVNQDFFKEKSFLFRQSLYFLVLLPLLIYLQVPTPLVILTNLFFTPLLEFVLFPLGLLVWVFPFLHPVFDWLIAGLKFVLLKFDLNWQFQKSAPPASLLILQWSLIFMLHAITYLAWLRRKRETKSSL